MKTRQEAAAATRKRILNTAGRLVAERGYDNVCVSDIVKACRIARGTFYLYFKNKADVMHEYTRLPFLDVEKRVSSMDAPVAERITAYVQDFTHCLEEYGLPVTQQWVREVADPRSSPESADNDKLHFDLDLLTRLLQQAVSSGELKEDAPTERLAEMITCQLYGQMTCWCMSCGKLDMSEVAQFYCSRLLPALLEPYLAKPTSS